MLQLLSALGGKVSRLLVVGCEPAGLEPDPEGSLGPSEPARAALDEAVRMIEELVRNANSRVRAA